jgi:hypothetical protein
LTISGESTPIYQRCGIGCSHVVPHRAQRHVRAVAALVVTSTRSLPWQRTHAGIGRRPLRRSCLGTNWPTVGLSLLWPRSPALSEPLDLLVTTSIHSAGITARSWCLDSMLPSGKGPVVAPGQCLPSRRFAKPQRTYSFPIDHDQADGLKAVQGTVGVYSRRGSRALAGGCQSIRAADQRRRSDLHRRREGRRANFDGQDQHYGRTAVSRRSRLKKLLGGLVDGGGIEPPTSALRTQRSPS